MNTAQVIMSKNPILQKKSENPVFTKLSLNLMRKMGLEPTRAQCSQDP